MKIGKHMHAELCGGQWTLTTKRGEVLGTVDWHEAWHRFEFVPAENAAFTSDCLRPLADFLDQVTADAKARGA